MSAYLIGHCSQRCPELCATSDRLILTLVSIEYDHHRSLQRAVDGTITEAMTRRIYIDIDGVCLRHASAYSSRTGVELAPHAFQFLRWAAGAHNPHWLTTRDAHGQHDGILRAFRLAIGSPTLPTEIEALLKSIKPTTWHGSKVSGIDLGSDFVWIDDQPLMVEIDALQGRNLLSMRAGGAGARLTHAKLTDVGDRCARSRQELRGILNSGHRRGGQVTRTVGDDHEPHQFSTWSPAAIAKIGRLPDTLNDRSVILGLRRRKASEKIASFREDRTEHLAVLARKMARWTQDHGANLAAADPDMRELVNRVADNWRPLFAIADEAGGKWPAQARKIASAAVQATVDQSINVLLFAAIKWIFDGCPGDGEAFTPTDRLASFAIVERLKSIEGHPWAEWKNGKPITQNGLARLLGKFEVLSGTIRFHSGETAKGYYRSAFNDVFARYLPSQSVTPSQTNDDGHCDTFQNVTTTRPVTPSETSQTNNDMHCDGVTVPHPSASECEEEIEL